MKKLLLSVALLCSVAAAQPPSAIPTGLSGPAYQSAVNAWMQYLYSNKIQGLSSSVDSEVLLFSGTGGKTIKRASLTGIPYMTSGVISAATSTHIIALFGSGSCSGYLKSDGTCDAPAGDVTGPGSSTTTAIVRFSGTTGKILQNSGVTIDGSDNVATAGTVTASNFQGDDTKNGAHYLQGVTSGGLAFSVANIAGTAVTLVWPADSATATTGYVPTLGGTVTCPTLLPSWAPSTCRSLSWGASGSLSASGTPLIHQLSAWTNATSLKGLTVGTDNQVLLGNTGADPSFGALPTAALPGEYYALSTGSSNAYIVAPTNAVTSYATGEKYFFKSSFANTSAASVDFNSVGAKTIKKVQGSVTTDLAANDIRGGQMVALMYDGTNMQMISQLGNAAGGATVASTTALLKGDGAGNASATDLTGDVTTSGAQATTLAAQYKKWSCQPGLGDGLNAIPAGTYLQTECYNDTSATITLSGIKCFTDNGGTSALSVTNGAGTALLTGAVTCSSSFATGTQSGTTTIASGDYLKFSFVADGTSKQSTWVITGSK